MDLTEPQHCRCSAERAEEDPEAAAWPLETRLRYDEHGNFSLVVKGPAEYAPLVRAGLDATKAELHHTLIHRQGFRLVLHPDRRLDVSTAEGVAVLHHPAQPWGDPAAVGHGVGHHVSAGDCAHRRRARRCTARGQSCSGSCPQFIRL